MQDNLSASLLYPDRDYFRIEPEYYPFLPERAFHISSLTPLLCDIPAGYCNNTSRLPHPDCGNQNPALLILWSENPKHLRLSFLIRIQLVEKGGEAPGSTEKHCVASEGVTYQSHVQTYGWQDWKLNGETSGTSGQSKRLEALKIKLENMNESGNVEYQSHVQTYGWEKNWKKNGELSGTSGKSKRLEAIKIRLTGEMKEKYDIYYRVHAQTYGWLGWAKNGESAGTEGLSKRLEAIEVVLVEKGADAPGSTEKTFIKK